MQIAARFDLSEKMWDYPCVKEAAIYILGMVYKTSGEAVGSFADNYSCLTPLTFQTRKSYAGGSLVPSRFDSQVDLPSGDYDLRLVVSDGHNFGRARIPLRVQPFDAQRLMMSDAMVGGVLRDAVWVAREVASVSPSPVIPTPLVSKGIQFFPDTDTPARLRKHAPLFLYFELYEPLLGNEKPTVYYRVRITDLKTGALLMNTEPLAAAEWELPGNVASPIGLKLATEKLEKGSYRLEIQASDSAGCETNWRQTSFVIQ